MNINEKIYILKRKLMALDNTIISLLCSVVPIDNNKIAVCTFEGRGGFGCNPKYIVEELHRRNSNYKFVWLVTDVSKEFPEYITPVRYTRWSRNYHLATSKLWLNNYRNPYGTRKRKGQYYIQTWHAGIGFKNIGLWRGDAFSRMAYLVSKNDSNMIDVVLADSLWCKEMFPNGLIYDGPIEVIGAPRCNPMYTSRIELRTKLREKFDIALDTKILMFAPTFRETSNDGKRGVYSELWSIDLENTLQCMKKRFGGDWIVAIRLHPQIADKTNQYCDSSMKDAFINLSYEPDMYELLPAIDALITDYSSTAFEAGLMEIPVFLYSDDLDSYIASRGGLFWDFSGGSKSEIHNDRNITPSIDAVLPYTVSENNLELEEAIESHNVDEYIYMVREFNARMGIVFDGKSVERASDIAEYYLENS